MISPARKRRGIVTGAGKRHRQGRALAHAARGRRCARRRHRRRRSLPNLAAGELQTMSRRSRRSGRSRAKVADAADGADYLVNSPASSCIKPIFEVTVEDWRRIQTINAESVFFLCQKIGPRLQPGGAIVNLSSSSAKLASTIEVATYAASKTTILSITRSFAYALASRPVRVNAICPGIVDTPMQDDGAGPVSRDARHDRGRARARRATRPCRSAAPRRAEECAGLIWFLLSEESGLHDRAGDQLHRRHGDVVTCKGGSHEEADDDLRDRPRPSRGALRARRRARHLRQYLCQRDRRLGPQDRQAGHLSPSSAAARMPACSAPTAAVYSTQTPNVGAWVAPEHRPPSIQKTRPDGKVEMLVTEADGAQVRRAERSDLRARTGGSGSPIPATGTRPTSRIPAASSCIEKNGTAHIVEELDHVYPERHRRRAGRVDRLGRVLHAPRHPPHARRQQEGDPHACPKGHIPDGLKIDVNGNLWITTVASGGVDVIAPTARTIDFLEVGRHHSQLLLRQGRRAVLSATWAPSTSPARR